MQACEISARSHGVHDSKIQNQDDKREQLETQYAVLRAPRRRKKHKKRWKIKTQSAATRYTSENFRPTNINYRSLVEGGKILIDSTLRSSFTTICIIHNTYPSLIHYRGKLWRRYIQIDKWAGKQKRPRRFRYSVLCLPDLSPPFLITAATWFCWLHVTKRAPPTSAPKYSQRWQTDSPNFRTVSTR